MSNKISVTYNTLPKVEITGNEVAMYDVVFYDLDNNAEMVYQDKIMNGHWVSVNRKYYTNWKVLVLKNGEEVYEDYFNCKNKNVVINIRSTALGDNISWVPYCEEFRKKHECNLTVICRFSNIFSKTYSNINWVNGVDEVNIHDYYVSYEIGIGIDNDIFKKNIKKLNQYFIKNIPIKYIGNLTFFDKIYQKEHPLHIPMQKIASNTLGLEYNEIRTKIECNNDERPIDDKYICISEFASAGGMKVWNNKIGWQTIIDVLSKMGYKIVSISKEKSNLKNLIKRNGDYDLNDRIWYLKHCEFFIGLPSGLSWLSWAVGKKTVMIGGFSEEWCEFIEDNIRVKNYDACGGCFNSPEHADKLCCFHDSFCPENKNFECSRKISPKMVLNKIIESNLI